MAILHATVRASESPPVFAGEKKGDIRLVKLVIVSNINPKVLKHKNNNIQVYLTPRYTVRQMTLRCFDLPCSSILVETVPCRYSSLLC